MSGSMKLKKSSANKWYRLIPPVEDGESQDRGPTRSASAKPSSKYERHSPATTMSTHEDTVWVSAGSQPSTRLTTPDHDPFAQADGSDCDAPAGTYEKQVEIDNMTEYQPIEYLERIDRNAQVKNVPKNVSGHYNKQRYDVSILTSTVHLWRHRTLAILATNDVLDDEGYENSGYIDEADRNISADERQQSDQSEYVQTNLHGSNSPNVTPQRVRPVSDTAEPSPPMADSPISSKQHTAKQLPVVATPRRNRVNLDVDLPEIVHETLQDDAFELMNDLLENIFYFEKHMVGINITNLSVSYMPYFQADSMPDIAEYFIVWAITLKDNPTFINESLEKLFDDDRNRFVSCSILLP